VGLIFHRFGEDFNTVNFLGLSAPLNQLVVSFEKKQHNAHFVAV
jgi:hypothetical protein